MACHLYAWTDISSISNITANKLLIFKSNKKPFMTSQEIINLKIEDLVLWTENPRDPISPDSNNQDVADKAFENVDNRWDLKKLISDMGDYYDYSELPIVVIEKGKPIVYDGNRRILLGKIQKGLIEVPEEYELDISKIPEFPDVLPCNVCSRDIALKSVCRKHSEIGTWDVLGRDIFMCKYMKEPKTPFLIVDEYTGLIRGNASMNKRFVKDEILTENVLERLGFKIVEEKLVSKLTEEGQRRVWEDLKEKISNKTFTTRKNRYKIYENLDEATRKLIENRKDSPYKDVTPVTGNPYATSSTPFKRTKRTKKKDLPLFGEPLLLKSGNVNDLYRDISSLGEYYLVNKEKLSNKFPALLRMSLRLIVETAGNDVNMTIEKYIDSFFDEAKKLLSQDAKTSLSSNSVQKNSIVQLLNIGAHNYTDSKSYDKAYAMSLIIAKMLVLSHKKQ